MPEDHSNIIDLSVKLGRFEEKLAAGSLKSNGSDGTSGGMETRVKALEDGQKRIEEKLDKLMTQSAELKGQLTGMPSAATFGTLSEKLGELKGRIDRLPSTTKVAAIIGTVAAAATVFAKWLDVKAAFGW